MLALQCNLLSLVAISFIALYLSKNGYKRLAEAICKGVLSTSVVYTLLVLIIGLH